jgi:hypothetical protein
MIRRILESALYVFTCVSSLLVAQQVNSTSETQKPANTAAFSPGTNDMIFLPKHTFIDLISLEEVSPATASKGQRVRLAVKEDVEVKGLVAIPRGTPATGVVASVRKAVPGKRDGFVGVRLLSLNLPGPSPVAITSWEDPSGDGMCTGFFCDLSLFVVVGPLWVGDLIAKPFRKSHETGKEWTIEACSLNFFAEPSGRAAVHPIRAGELHAPSVPTELDEVCPDLRRDPKL